MAVVERLTQGDEGTRNFTIQQSEQQKLETRAILMEERMKRSTTYQPYTDNPYDLGPLNQCTTPKVSQCSYSSDVTIPEYQARRINYAFDAVNSFISDQFKQALGPDSQCFPSFSDLVSNLMCVIVATPRCVGDDTVNYQSLSVSVRLYL